MDRRMVGEERGVTMTEKKKFQVPHSMAIIVAAMILASILTYLIPGGNFERVVNDAGKTVVVPGSFTYVEQTPVNPLTILDYVFSGMGYRLFCMIPFLIVSIVYIVLYGRKVKADPTKSYIYGNKVDFGDFDPENVPLNNSEKRTLLVGDTPTDSSRPWKSSMRDRTDQSEKPGDPGSLQAAFSDNVLAK